MRIITTHKYYILLLIIFLIALLLRVYKLADIPVGMHGDEASIGYNAYSLFKTARDQDGNFLPLAFDQFGNFRAAGYQYVDIPFVALLGLNSLAVRLPAALFGSLTVVVFYFFLTDFFKNKKTALIGAFLFATLPWHVNISRASSEGVISSFFVLLGIYLIYKAVMEKTISFALFLLSFFSLLLSFFFYHAAGPFVLTFLPFLFLFGFLRPSKTSLIMSIIMYFGLALGLILFLTAGSGIGRISQVNIFSIPGGTNEVKQAMDEDGVQNPLITRFYHNKLYHFDRLFITFSSLHLSGDFLFVNNGNPIRYKMPWTGNLYLIVAPFLIFGFAILLSEGIKEKKYLFLIPIAWLFTGVIPAALTFEDLPNVVRANLMIPALVMIAAFGVSESLRIFKGRVRTIFIIISALILSQNISSFLHNYFHHLRIHEPWHRSAAEAELIFTVDDYLKKNKKVIMTTESNNNFIFYLFYNKFDPAEFQRRGSPKEKENLVFDNIKYTYHPCPLEGDPRKSTSAKEGFIYVNKPDCKLPKNAEILHEIHTPDGSQAFYILKLREVDEATLYRESQIQ